MGSYLAWRQFCLVCKCLKILETSCQHFQHVGCSYKLWNSGFSWKIARPRNMGIIFPPGISGLELVAAAPPSWDTCFLGDQFPLDDHTHLDCFPGLHGHLSLLPLPCLPWPLLCCLCLIFPACVLTCLLELDGCLVFPSLCFLSNLLSGFCWPLLPGV